MSLVKPILNPIPAFDATDDFIITFVASGGDEVTGNELKIVTNDISQTVVYDNTITSNLLQHTIPANTLTNGHYYYATVRTYNSLNENSEWSLNKPFYCFSEPTLEFNINDGATIATDTFQAYLTYNQIEGEYMVSGRIELYNINGTLNQTSDELYDSSSPPNVLTWTFNVENDKSYILIGTITTEHGTVVTKTVNFNVDYSAHTGDFFYVTVDNCEGEVKINTEGIVALNGEIEKNFHGIVNGDTGDFVQYDNIFYANLVSLDGVDPSFVSSSPTYASVSLTNFPLPTDFLFGVTVVPALIDQEIIRFTDTYSPYGSYSKYISISINRGIYQDYISIRTNNGTSIDKGLGVFCNGHIPINIFLRMVDGMLSLDFYIDTNRIVSSILDWNNNTNNNVYNMFTSSIIFENQNAGNFIPNNTVLNQITDTFNYITFGNGLYDNMVLSTNAYSDDPFTNNPSNIFFFEFNGDWDNTVGEALNKVILERRLVTDTNWVQIGKEDLIPNTINYLTFIDKYIPTGQVDYKLKMYHFDDIVYESSIVTNIKWDFVFISDIDETYRLQSGVIYSNNQQNIQNNILMPIGATYPIVVQNANGNYRSGSVQFTVLGYEFDDNQRLNRISMTKQLNDIMLFLTNTKPKVIKDFNGNIFIIRIVNNPQVSYDANWGNNIPKVSFDWVEQGKYDDMTDMKELGFYN